jgi:hypothetical protein
MRRRVPHLDRLLRQDGIRVRPDSLGFCRPKAEAIVRLKSGSGAAAQESDYGAMMRDGSRLSSGAAGNWLRRNSTKRRERGRPLVRNNPMR